MTLPAALPCPEPQCRGCNITTLTGLGTTGFTVRMVCLSCGFNGTPAQHAYLESANRLAIAAWNAVTRPETPPAPQAPAPASSVLEARLEALERALRWTYALYQVQTRKSEAKVIAVTMENARRLTDSIVADVRQLLDLPPLGTWQTDPPNGETSR